MSRTITVKGTGSISVKPDLVTITITLNSDSKVYAEAAEIADSQIAELRATVVKAGLPEEELKTKNFSVFPEYESVLDERGIYQNVFRGYRCTHHLTLSFGLDRELLSVVLAEITSCSSSPEINISFSVKDVEQIKEELLRSATVNAHISAQCLCDSCGVKLGQLISIDYTWHNVPIASSTMCDMAECGGVGLKRASFCAKIEPESINISDTATFVWEIE